MCVCFDLCGVSVFEPADQLLQNSGMNAFL